MRHSPNLSIIIKAIDKISGRLARDFGEIENLQTNHFSATKFANSCYQRIKKDLAEDLMKIHPTYNLEFIDGDKITNNNNAEYNYIICPIDGIANLSRSIPGFTIIIALEHNSGGKKEIIASAISNIANNELYWCEKGGGAFLGNRRIRVSNRSAGDNAICAVSGKELLKHPLINNAKFDFRLTNCLSLDIGYLASGRIDLALFSEADEPILKLVSLLLKEAGGSLTTKDGILVANNGKINLS